MTFQPTGIPGAFVIRVEPWTDARGHFARVWCRDEFAAHGIAADMVQASVSHNRLAGTLRGLHFSIPPTSEGKLVRCQRGRIHDVLLDLRPSSPAYLTHFVVQLSAESHDAVYAPPGVAHGFQTLEPDSNVFYMMSDRYRPDLAAGVRYDDCAFGLRWPMAVTAIAERDRSYPDYDPAGFPSLR